MIASWRALVGKERMFAFFAMLSGFMIAVEYGMTRPVSSALFLTQFSSEMLPWVWLATVPLNLGTIFLYNKWVARFGPLKMFWIVNALVAGGNVFTGILYPYFPELIFLHYAWKDIYILLMFKQLWSLIHTGFSSHQAKGVYGVIFAMGSLGSLAGSLLPGFFATEFGAEKLFFLSLPLYWILGYSFQRTFHLSSAEGRAKIEEVRSFKEGGSSFALIKKSRLLLAALLIVVFMQVSIGLMEYQFNSHLEIHVFGKDLRAEYYGRVLAIVNMISLGLQAVGSFLVIHLFGLRGAHLLIPLILLGNAMVSLAFPFFGMVSLAYIVVKAIDFSLFSVSREMLYIPMALEEKYRAKAIIDVFAYRTSKAFVSLGILGLQLFLGAFLLPILKIASICIFVVWIGAVFFLLRGVNLHGVRLAKG